MVTSDVAANDAIAEAGTAQNVTDGPLDAAILVLPGVLIVAHPGNGRGIERRKTFGMTPRAIQRADERDEFGILCEAVLILTAGEAIHVLARGHPAGMNPIEGHGQFSQPAGEKRVAAIELPAVHAPVEHLLLETVPPFHGFGIRVVYEPALALPPFDRGGRQVAVGPRRVVKVLGLGRLRVLAMAVHHASHPEHHAIALILQAAKKFLRLGVTVLVHLEIVVAPAPRAINQDGAHREIVLRVPSSNSFTKAALLTSSSQSQHSSAHGGVSGTRP